MKNRISFLIIISIAFCNLKSQNIYFNKRYSNFGASSAAFGIDTFTNKYITYGVTTTSVTFYALNLKLYDYSNGNNTLSKTYQLKGNNFLPNGKGILINKNTFAVCGMRAYKTDTSLAFLWKFDKNLDSVSYKEYGFLNQANVFYGMTLGKDNCIYMIGWVNNSSGTNGDILLVKTDTSGNEIWKKRIGLSNWTEEGYGLSNCKNGDLLLSGVRYVPNYSSANQGPLITRIDTAGNIKWQKFYPSLAYADGSWSNKELPNGDIVFSGSKARFVGTNTMRRSTFTKLDSLGNTKWSKVFGKETESYDFYSFLGDGYGNFILSGQDCYPANTNGIVYGVAFKLDANGDSVTSREYYIDPLAQNYFRGMLRTSDKGYIFPGWITPIGVNGCTGTPDVWLLKTDSLLCEYSNCPLASPMTYTSASDFDNINEQQNNSNWKIRIYPNPTNGKITIESSYQLYNNILLIRDALGREILNYTFKEINEKQEVDLSKLMGGIYFIQLQSENKIITRQKIIKE